MVDESDKAELEELVEKLENIRGRQTELITVYIPAGYNVNATQKQLESEKGTAKNIKSTATRNNVIDALEKIVRFLKDFKKTPKNGMAIFCGNVSKVEGQQDLQLWSIEPPQPLKSRLYRCDKEFVLDALKEMLEVDEVYGLLVMDRKEATIGVLEGKRVEVLQKMTSGVPSKIRAGGQCLSPDTLVNIKGKGEVKINSIKKGDLIEGINLNTMKNTFNKCLKKWIVNKKEPLSLITDGDYPSSHLEVSTDHLFYVYNKNKVVEKIASDLKMGNFLISKNGKLVKILSIDILGGENELIDLEVENSNFLANRILVHNSSQRFHRITEGLTKEFYKRIADEMKKCFFDMKKLKGILVGGPIPTKDEFLEGKYLVTKLQEKIIGRIDVGDADESGLNELVGKSQDILSEQESIKEKKLLEKFFETLGSNPEKAFYDIDNVKRALKYGAVDILILSKKYDKTKLKELRKMAENTGAKIEVVSTDTTEGEQFYNLSGIGALLRFGI